MPPVMDLARKWLTWRRWVGFPPRGTAAPDSREIGCPEPQVGIRRGFTTGRTQAREEEGPLVRGPTGGDGRTPTPCDEVMTGTHPEIRESSRAHTIGQTLDRLDNFIWLYGGPVFTTYLN